MLREFATKPKNKLQWLFWWLIDPDELQDQVAKYQTLGWLDSSRKLSVLFLLFSTGVTVIFGGLGAFAAAAYVEAAIMGLFAAFIYRGHRWAMIGAMVLWTFEKAFGALAMLATNPFLIIFQFFWWCFYMHAFYLAFRVEQARKNSLVTSLADFD